MKRRIKNVKLKSRLYSYNKAWMKYKYQLR